MWEKTQRRTIGGLLLAMTPFWTLFPALGLTMLAVSPPFVAWLLGEAAGDAVSLLVIARRWYCLLLAAMALAAALSLGMVVWALRRLARRGQLEALAGYLGVMALVCVGGEIALFGALIHLEELPQHIVWAGEDLESIEKDQLETAICFISPKAHPHRLPGPYTENLPEPFTCYGVIGEDTGGQWVRLLVPNGMEFQLDPERLYDEDRNIGWNEEHAQRYLVRYTNNFQIVTEIEPWEPRRAVG